MQSVRSAPSASSSCRYSERQFRTRAIGTGRRRLRRSTPSPSRVIVNRRATSSSRSPSTSATRSRVEFVPRSTAATRLIWPGGTRGASVCGAEPSRSTPAARRAARARHAVARSLPVAPGSNDRRRRAAAPFAPSAPRTAASSLVNSPPVRLPCAPEREPANGDDEEADERERETDEKRGEDHDKS